MSHWQFIAGYGAAAATALVTVILVVAKRVRNKNWTSAYASQFAPGVGVLAIAVFPIFLGVLMGWLFVHDNYDDPRWVYQSPATAPGWSHHISKVVNFAQKEVDEPGGHGHTYQYFTNLVITQAGDEVAVDTYLHVGSFIHYGCPNVGTDVVDNVTDKAGDLATTISWAGCFAADYVYSYQVPPPPHTPLAWWMMPAGFGLWLVPLGVYLLAWPRRR